MEGVAWLVSGPYSCVSLSHEEGGGSTSDAMEEGELGGAAAVVGRGEVLTATLDASDNTEADVSRIKSASELTPEEGRGGGRVLENLRRRKKANMVCALGIWVVGC